MVDTSRDHEQLFDALANCQVVADLRAHGLMLLQVPTSVRGRPRVVTTLRHTSGQWMRWIVTGDDGPMTAQAVQFLRALATQTILPDHPIPSTTSAMAVMPGVDAHDRGHGASEVVDLAPPAPALTPAPQSDPATRPRASVPSQRASLGRRRSQRQDPTVAGTDPLSTRSARNLPSVISQPRLLNAGATAISAIERRDGNDNTVIAILRRFGNVDDLSELPLAKLSDAVAALQIEAKATT
jgi:hypothetical protein